MQTTLRARVSLVGLIAVVLSCGGPVASAHAQASWYDAAWPHRVKITVAAGAVAAAVELLDFPAVLDAEVLAAVLDGSRADGADLVVTRADGTTRLPLQVVAYDPVQDRAEVWFRADRIAADARDFYVYYGNSQPAPSMAGSVWNDDYVAVYHFEEDPGAGVLKDWTAAGSDARANQPISNWTSADLDTGRLGRGWRFNGTTHYINTNRISTADGSFSISAWLKHTTRSTDFMFQANPGFWQLASQASSQSNHAQFKDGSVEARFQPGQIPLNEFHHFAWVFDEQGGQVSFFFDGVAQGTIFFWPPETDPSDYYVGHAINPDGPAGGDLVGILGPMFHNDLDLFNGVGDEFRINETMLSPAWIATEVANQSAPSSFFSVSPEETKTPNATSSFGTFKGQHKDSSGR